jgi:hypothetical protein
VKFDERRLRQAETVIVVIVVVLIAVAYIVSKR